MQGYRPRRRPSGLRVTVKAQGWRRDATVLDVSEAGLKLALSEPPPPDTAIEVSTPRITRQARVRWTGRGTVGLILSEPLSASEQAELSGMACSV